jgi:hypothetical protein
MFLYNLTLSRPSGIQVRCREGGRAHARRRRCRCCCCARRTVTSAALRAVRRIARTGALQRAAPAVQRATPVIPAPSCMGQSSQGRWREPAAARPAAGRLRAWAPPPAPLRAPAPPPPVCDLRQLLGAQGPGARRVARPLDRAAAPQRQRQARHRRVDRRLRHRARARGVPADGRVAGLRNPGVGQRAHRDLGLPRGEGGVCQGAAAERGRGGGAGWGG